MNGGPASFSDVAVSHSLSSSDINTLALNFRATDNTSPLYVSTLTPGVQTDPSGNISVAGGFPYTTSYSIDGISTVNARFNGPSVNLFPSVEAISEFKVKSANNDAEFSQPSDITVTTKSGTNHFHGGIYEFLQNSYLNAANPVTHTQGPLKANDSAATSGVRCPSRISTTRRERPSSSATTKAPAVPSPAPSLSRFHPMPFVLETSPLFAPRVYARRPL